MTPERMQKLLADAATSVESFSAGEALQLHNNADVVFLDVREDHERSMGFIDPSLHKTLGSLLAACEAGQADTLKLPSDKQLIVYCATGVRSLLAAKLLQDQGVTNVANISGGIQAWLQVGGSVAV